VTVYSAYGFSAAAGGGEPFAALWNPHASKRIVVYEFGFYFADSGFLPARYLLHRTTARGTAGSTVTPDADNAWDGDTAPVSGVVLDLANFTGVPTLASPALVGTYMPATTAGEAGTGFVAVFRSGLIVPAGAGLAWDEASGAIAAPAAAVYAVWEEGL